MIEVAFLGDGIDYVDEYWQVGHVGEYTTQETDAFDEVAENQHWHCATCGESIIEQYWDGTISEQGEGLHYAFDSDTGRWVGLPEDNGCHRTDECEGGKDYWSTIEELMTEHDKQRALDLQRVKELLPTARAIVGELDEDLSEAEADEAARRLAWDTNQQEGADARRALVANAGRVVDEVVRGRP